MVLVLRKLSVVLVAPLIQQKTTVLGHVHKLYAVFGISRVQSTRSVLLAEQSVKQDYEMIIMISPAL